MMPLPLGEQDGRGAAQVRDCDFLVTKRYPQRGGPHLKKSK
jgi:hypothetical protein